MSNEKVFDLMEAANELTSEDVGTDSSSTENLEVEGQSHANPEESTDEVNPRDILDKVGQEQVDSESFKQTLEQINQLGAIHNGQPVAIDSPEMLKEIIQKGFDYTKKTMAHAEDVRLKTEEFATREAKYKETEQVLAQKEQEMESTVNDNNIITALLTEWQTKDPELFSFIQSAYVERLNQFNAQKPVIARYEGQFKELQNEIQQLKGGKQTEELSSIKQGWEKDLGDTQARTASSLAKLGVKVDWDKVKDVWSSDATGKMGVEDALYAAFGKDIAKANQSYQKLLTTRNKANAAKIQRTGVSSGSRGERGDVVFKAGDYESLLRGSI